VYVHARSHLHHPSLHRIPTNRPNPHTTPTPTQINAFAADTGHSVAVFTIGGVLSDRPDSDDAAADHILKPAPCPSHPDMKLAVLKYGSGGVARQLVLRPEIVKFVAARGSKALAELADRGQP
jgi:hypothetical protein